ncbi:hypothetical protein VTK73DRAFT_6843 [Phialemonium thermophilum]|uniref:CN hydrolase domain-containing protein n=1 Tax=Phialemonium thermophilum TaxID=223376 RepID=A0ABR3Y817_9PEZI
MRIACLQFAPQVGDVNNNLNRADAVLSKANKEELEGLDLLVLPQLAFSGYNFKSLAHISPFLEYAGSGISSLWARTIALKYNCVVSVGYPEKVDVRSHWPCSPEYYNSTIMVNGDGETIANYRQSFLYYIDETWALEGRDGFFQGYIPNLGRTAMGICMDINPYKFEAPWHAFEFAFHILEIDANLVIVNMAWATRDNPREFSRVPQEPDMDTLRYWVERLEPVIRAETAEEIIVVFCNRCGIEDDLQYAGTSAVQGIKKGEVSVYGLLGRGVKELLIVDTDKPPFAKLVRSFEPEVTVAGSREHGSQTSSPAHKTGENVISATREFESAPKLASSSLRSSKPTSLRVRIPPTTRFGAGEKLPEAESPVVETPTAPSPTPHSLRPKLTIPSPDPTFDTREATPYPHDHMTAGWPPLIIGGNVTAKVERLSPATPSAEAFEPSPASSTTRKYFWTPSSNVKEPPTERRRLPTVPDSSALRTRTPQKKSPRTSSRQQEFTNDASTKTKIESRRPVSDGPRAVDAVVDVLDKHPTQVFSCDSKYEVKELDENDFKSNSSVQLPWPDAKETSEELQKPPTSELELRPGRRASDGSVFHRPRSPKSRNASRDRSHRLDLMLERRQNASQASIPIAASPSCFSTTVLPLPDLGPGFGPASLGLQKVDHTVLALRETPTNSSRLFRSRSYSAEIDIRAPVFASHPGLVGGSPIRRPETAMGIQTSDQGVALRHSYHRSRDISRGRQPGKTQLSDRSNSTRTPSFTRQYSQGKRSASMQSVSTNYHHGSTSTRVIFTPAENLAPARASMENSDDIVAFISRATHDCPVHRRRHENDKDERLEHPPSPDRGSVYEVSLPASVHTLAELLVQTTASSRRSSFPILDIAKTPNSSQEFDPPTPRAMVV